MANALMSRRESKRPPVRKSDVGKSETAGSDAEDFSAMRASAEAAAELMRSIGSAHRLMILCLLMEGPKTVSELCADMDARQSLVSQHLLRLRQDRLVNSERRGHFVHYSLNDTPAREIVAVLRRHFCADQASVAN